MSSLAEALPQQNAPQQAEPAQQVVIDQQPTLQANPVHELTASPLGSNSSSLPAACEASGGCVGCGGCVKGEDGTFKIVDFQKYLERTKLPNNDFEPSSTPLSNIATSATKPMWLLQKVDAPAPKPKPFLSLQRVDERRVENKAISDDHITSKDDNRDSNEIVLPIAEVLPVPTCISPMQESVLPPTNSVSEIMDREPTTEPTSQTTFEVSPPPSVDMADNMPIIEHKAVINDTTHVDVSENVKPSLQPHVESRQPEPQRLIPPLDTVDKAVIAQEKDAPLIRNTTREHAFDTAPSRIATKPTVPEQKAPTSVAMEIDSVVSTKRNNDTHEQIPVRTEERLIGTGDTNAANNIIQIHREPRQTTVALLLKGAGGQYESADANVQEQIHEEPIARPTQKVIETTRDMSSPSSPTQLEEMHWEPSIPDKIMQQTQIAPVGADIHAIDTNENARHLRTTSEPSQEPNGFPTNVIQFTPQSREQNQQYVIANTNTTSETPSPPTSIQNPRQREETTVPSSDLNIDIPSEMPDSSSLLKQKVSFLDHVEISAPSPIAYETFDVEFALASVPAVDNVEFQAPSADTGLSVETQIVSSTALEVPDLTTTGEVSKVTEKIDALATAPLEMPNNQAPIEHEVPSLQNEAVALFKTFLKKEQNEKQSKENEMTAVLQVNDRMLIAKVQKDMPQAATEQQSAVDESLDLTTSKELVGALSLILSPIDSETEGSSKKQNAVIIRVSDTLADHMQNVRTTIESTDRQEPDQSIGTTDDTPILLVAKNNFIIMPRAEVIKILAVYDTAINEIASEADIPSEEKSGAKAFEPLISSHQEVVIFSPAALKLHSEPPIAIEGSESAVEKSKVVVHTIDNKIMTGAADNTPDMTSPLLPIKSMGGVAHVIETVLENTTNTEIPRVKHESAQATEEVIIHVAEKIFEEIKSFDRQMIKKPKSELQKRGINITFSYEDNQIQLNISTLQDLLERIRKEQEAIEILQMRIMKEMTTEPSWFAVSLFQTFFPQAA